MREGDGKGDDIEVHQNLDGMRHSEPAPAFSILTILTADIQNFLDSIWEHHLLSRIQQTWNINSVNTNWFTLLMLVVRNKELRLFRHLLKHLPREYVFFKSGWYDAIDMAISLLDDRLISILIEFGYVEPTRDSSVF